MGYNPLNVSAGRGNTTTGPLFYNPTEQLTKLVLGQELTTAAGWIRLGEGSTDGVESTQSSTVTPKNVWGAKNLGNTFSEFTDTLIANYASAFDPDVLGAVFGRENVIVDANEVLTIVKARTPGFGTYVFQVKLDDGRDHWLVIPAGQPDPNLTRTFTDSDIVVIATTLMAAERTITDGEDEYVVSHYELTEPLPAVPAK